MMQKFARLEEIFKQQVFELCGPFGEDYYVPYMMNDALEDYLILKKCRLVGEYVRDLELSQEMQLAESEHGYVLAVRQGDENAFTLYFETIEESVAFYQYHEIGHFWVKGQEQWRQLVYIIGTIYDKFQYLGEEVCNAQEMELLPLMEFAPFREWSPIRDSLEEMYPATYEGISAMEKFAKEIGDENYCRWIALYRKFAHNRVLGDWFCRKLQDMLLEPAREKLYGWIWDKVVSASCTYPKRKYEEPQERCMEEVRKRVTSDLEARGFSGAYPEFEKNNTKILVTEEHPFTIMEWEHYKFRVQLMVSQCEPPIENKRNSGFFKGRGRKGWIEDYE